MKRLLWTFVMALAVCLGTVVPVPARGRCPSPILKHAADQHLVSSRHTISCGTQIVGSVQVSEDGGLGRLDIAHGMAAVLERDAGAVSLVDVSNPSRPAVVGRFDNDAQQSLDGDVSFSDDGRWLFYARQTVRFSQDGIHVLDVGDPSAPAETSYQPQGGTLRIAYFSDGSNEWVFSLDAVTGLVVNRFVRSAGILVPVFAGPLPAQKVGGPSSGGLFIEPNDPELGIPLLYAASGHGGIEVFDISNPDTPEQIATAPGPYSEIEVLSSEDTRLIFAATEYWFDGSSEPAVDVLDARDFAFDRVGRLSASKIPDALWRVQGMALDGNSIAVAQSHAGVVIFDTHARVVGIEQRFGDPHATPNVPLGAPYAFDIAVDDGLFFVTDAVTGRLTIVKRG